MTDHIEALSIRELLEREPLSYSELLKLFEAYIATIDGPLNKACNLIHEELNYREGDIFGHIVVSLMMPTAWRSGLGRSAPRITGAPM